VRVSFLCWLGFLLAVGVAAAADERIQAGPLLLDVYVSQTAARFHVVDQLSEWSYFSHRQYRRDWGPLNDADQAMLAKHKAVRARHPWGRGLEQTFYTPLPLDEALRVGTDQGWLTPKEAVTEREVLLYFAPRVDALAAAQASALDAFRQRMRQELAQQVPILESFARFTGNTPGLVPVFLLPDPDARNHGGGYNGGRLTIEVPTQEDAMPTALHELFHAFIDPSKSRLAAEAQGVPGLDEETLNEGLAYAFSPGIVHAGPAAGDPLARLVAADRAAGKRLTDPYTRFRRFGLALRPLLQDALTDDRQTLTSFLPRAVAVWREIQGDGRGQGLAPVRLKD